jgi:ADP-heptose:LPS heptosyltransferase
MHMNILVRLPNWLGDLVMALPFLTQLRQRFPDARIDVIVKKGIHELMPFVPGINEVYVFSKATHKGLGGAWRFGGEIRKKQRYDLFFSLPDSFSSAAMGFATGAAVRVGYRNELRQVLLTKSFQKPLGLHRAEEYSNLLGRYLDTTLSPASTRLQHAFPKKDYVVLNINSEAVSRRLTPAKAVEMVRECRARLKERLYLIGAPAEAAFVTSVLEALPDRRGVESLAGKTTLPQLAEVLASARLVLSTDSGPAHLANALGTHTVVLFGAGNEANTAPFNSELRTIIRLGKLECEPCRKNVCVRYGQPQCLELLNTPQIVATLQQQLHNG